MDAKSLDEILTALICQVVTVINLHSLIPILTGYKIDVETYKAKVISYEQKTLKILIEFLKDPHKNVSEKALQFIPTKQIKRVTMSKNERFITI